MSRFLDKQDDTVVQGPSCETCHAMQAPWVRKASNLPSLTSPYGKQRYMNPSYATYVRDVRRSRHACASGRHGLGPLY